MRKNAIISVTLVVMLAVLIAGCDQDEVSPNILIGEWQVTTATKDAVVQNDWKGAVLTITGDGMLGGEYRVDNRPYDSIWNEQGVWSREDLPQILLLDSVLNVDIAVTETTLLWQMLIPDNSNPCIPDSTPCLLPIKGNWVFNFERQ